MASLNDHLEKDYAPAWRPQAGDKLVGEIIDISERNGYDDRPYPILTVRPESGAPVSVHAFHTVLRNELAQQRPQIGERVGIKYEGEFATEGGRGRYHRYRVRVDRPQAAFSWSDYGGEQEQLPETERRPDTTQQPDEDDIPF